MTRSKWIALVGVAAGLWALLLGSLDGRFGIFIPRPWRPCGIAAFVMASTLIVMAVHGAIFLENSGWGLKDTGWRDGRGAELRRGMFMAGLSTAAVVAVCFAVEIWMSVSARLTGAIGAGALYATWAIRKPFWFWEHPGMCRQRAVYGDRVSTAVNLAFAGVLGLIVWFV